eukprot:CAMPEP_0171107518 /NCGR_PEP_ID=MMETSP0766_2-20121228/67018_1 /TAXON_ID=439317 /ORGANISM="Gambierdiscus australes, Strain CAWD 149" /LENGTH=36 /DNA_ID= /DNA_START= /DNA_END= /DNA_ORIENTATION=
MTMISTKDLGGRAQRRMRWQSHDFAATAATAWQDDG